MKIKIIAAVVDTRQLTLYKENGDAVVIPQGDPRLARIVAEATPFLARNEPVEVDLATETVNHYKDFEESSGGLVKFFRVAKNKLKSLFAASAEAEPKTIQPMTLGTVPGTKEEKITAAVAEIMQHAVSVSAPEFDDQEISEDADNTVIAVMQQVNAAPAIVTNIESIKPQLAHANANGSTIGVQRFMERMAAVVNKRRHSVEDLMKFLQKGDLPIADDGSIIIYKVLKTKYNTDGFYDCHTGLVPQKVGSYVCMDESLVDPDRRNECSNGLHVARRGYVSGFSGDVCVLAKINPEDVIAVPDHDANKMRVCGYHILFELSKEDHRKLQANKPITDTVEGQRLLGKVIAGDHVGILEEVRIGGHKGTNIKVTPMVAPVAKEVESTLVVALPDKGKAVQAPVVEPKAVVEAITKATEVVKPSEVVTVPTSSVRQQKAKALWDTMMQAGNDAEMHEAAKQLRSFKKTAKVSWVTLGLQANAGDIVALKLPQD